MGNYHNGNGNKCPICGKKHIEINCNDSHDKYFYYACPNCGNFYAPDIDYDKLIKDSQEFINFSYNLDHLKSFLFYHKSKNRPFLVSKKEYDDLEKSGYDKIYNLTSEMVENWYPKNISDKIDLILLELGRRAKFVGDSISIHKYEDDPFLFITQNDIEVYDLDICTDIQAKFILDAMCDLGYIKYELVESSFGFARTFEITILVKGYSRIYELQKSIVNNKNVFVAMSFNPAIENIYNAIDSAIRKAKCDVVSMKHRIHNKQIVPEMLRLIKESKILVMDISEPNFGAYYEAGYAQGLGKEVIITCKSSVIKKDKFPCDDKKGAECELLMKYSKPHFDIAQKQILVWEDEADLTEQLTEWIKFLVG